MTSDLVQELMNNPDVRSSEKLEKIAIDNSIQLLTYWLID
jgi:hypothetical protein